MSRFASVLSLLCLSLPVFAQVQSFDPQAINKSVDPCVDFYQYACGNWLANNPIPPDQTRWGRFSELSERNRTILKDILETSAASPDAGPVEQKIGAYYTACMDEKGIEAKGLAPIKPVLAEIAALPDKKTLAAEVVKLHHLGVPVLFHFSSTQDYKDSKEQIAEAGQGGLGLPDRDYYLKEDPKSVELRKQYLAHIQKMFELLGDSPETAAGKAQAVMTIETGLAKGSLDRVSMRDPAKTYHRLETTAFESLAPSFDLKYYLAKIGAPDVKSLNVVSPDFFKTINAELDKTSLDDWKTYLAWHYIRDASPLLPKAFADENFNFYSRTLRGQKEQRPRWKRCVAYTDSDLGEALGQKYVELTFGKEGKARTLKMVEELEKALGKDIESLAWMTPETKKRAIEKLHAITNKIGYPDQWRKYTFEVKSDDALGNAQRASAFELQRHLNKIGQPVDKKEWLMSPPTVNAYYDPQNNNINFPAGILQPPFYDNKIDDAVNFGGIGAVIGHELTHGFDDEGRQFDAKGNLDDWWTEKDATQFTERADCFVKQYGSYTPVADVKLNGKLTLGENTADNGGLRIAMMALLDAMTPGERGKKIDGYTPEQRFFLSWGQIWCTADREETARMLATVDPHSPGKFRVNGVLTNMPEFQKAFGCKAGQPMVSANACRVW
jgi:putative endopeptidase